VLGEACLVLVVGGGGRRSVVGGRWSAGEILPGSPGRLSLGRANRLRCSPGGSTRPAYADGVERLSALDVRERILEATYECVARDGIAQTSLEDAARAAGVSRATLYRYFPGGREELVSSVITWETLRFFDRLAEAVADAPDLETLLVTGIVFAHQSIASHEVLQRILGTEPELLTPQLSVDTPRIMSLVKSFFVARIGEYQQRGGRLQADLTLDDAADYCARMALSFISSPGRWDLDDREQVRELVRSEVLAGLLA
jgi:AcrR family transcriptional regulator